jgi:hypothetical protein
MSIVLCICSRYVSVSIHYRNPVSQHLCHLKTKDVISYRLKSKVFPVHTIRAYVGSRSIASLILNVGFRWRWLNGHCLRHREKSPRCTLNRRLGGPQSWSGHFGDKGKSVVYAGIRNSHAPPPPQPGAQLRRSFIQLAFPAVCRVELQFSLISNDMEQCLA